jgi:four helix bundle protein
MRVCVMKENIVKDKSFAFAKRIVKLYEYLCDQKREFIMSKQVMRSGTAVGALVREAECAETRNDFKHKLGLAQKEINETLYWLELLKETDYLNGEEFDSIYTDALELIKLITAILVATKKNLSTG